MPSVYTETLFKNFYHYLQRKSLTQAAGICAFQISGPFFRATTDSARYRVIIVEIKMVKADEWLIAPDEETFFIVEGFTLLAVVLFIIIWHLISWWMTTGTFDEPIYMRFCTRILQFWTLDSKHTFYVIVWGYPLAMWIYVTVLWSMGLSTT